jgi:hypothetical protein
MLINLFMKKIQMITETSCRVNWSTRLFLLVCITYLFPVFVFSQQYEIQVYESNTTEKGITDLELHSNFIFDGSRKQPSGVMYTNHLFDETIELTHGFTEHFETAIYLFTTFGNDNRTGIAGARIRTRLGYSQSENLPLGLGISAEFGRQDARFFGSAYGLEVKAILDRHFGKLYLSLNPNAEFGWDKYFGSRVIELSPCYAIKYSITEKINAGLEYYTDLGPIQSIEPFSRQGQALFPVFEMELPGNINLNAGLGFKLNQNSDNLVFKLIIGKFF